MEKKFKFSDKPLKTKIVYGVVIAILCITAIVIGIVSASSRSKDTPPPIDDTPPITDGNTGTNTPDDGTGNENEGNNTPGDGDQNNKEPEKKPLAFISPAVGTVTKKHSLDTPVFSATLGEWRVHAGIDIATEENAPVYAAEDGVVTKIYNDPRFGYTVEVQHSDDIITKYSNLSSSDVEKLGVGDEIKSGDRIGIVGDSSIAELAEEPHLHFEVLLRGVKVNPLDYLTKESQESSLGIKG